MRPPTPLDRLRVHARWLTLLLLPLVGVAAPDPVRVQSFSYTGADPLFAAPLASGYYQNPILAGYYPDPSICRVGDDYYLINSSFAHFPGIPIFHSRDLVNWRQLGHVVDRPSQLNYDGLGITRGLFAPAISHHDDVFYVVCTMIGKGGNFIMTATDPAGPWSDPVWLGFDGIDPSLFFDDDGRAWLVNNGNPPDDRPLYSGHRAIWIQEFDPKQKRMIGPRQIIVNGGADIATKPVWIEGPHLYKREGWYYLCCAEGGTSTQHSQVILRAKSPTGPFLPWEQNPILTQRDLDGDQPNAITCTGHADLVIGPDGNWWSVFLACRPYAPDRWATGRETFLLPVTWTADGWPRILPEGERVPLVVKAPNVAALTDPTATGRTPLTGNFTWRDEFDGPTLSPLWLMLRAPKETWWRLDAGQLLLTPRAVTLEGTDNPTFLGRRVQHATFDTAVTIAPSIAEKVQTGLAVVQSEKQQFRFQLERVGAAFHVSVLQCHQGKTVTLANRTIPINGTTSLQLQLHAETTRYHFRLVRDNGAVETVAADIDSYPITVQAAGGGLHFTGALVGVFATRSP